MKRSLGAIAGGCFACLVARAFVPSRLPTSTRGQLQVLSPLGFRSDSDNFTALTIWTRHRATKSEDEGRCWGMPPTSHERHHPSALRNRGVIASELVKWVDGGRDDAGFMMLEVASGTGCHAESFAKVLPAWTFQPTEYDRALIPDILATIEEGQYGNIRPPVQLDVCSDARSWPRPGGGVEQGEGSGERMWDAVICSNMIHISPKECTSGLLKGAAAGLKMGGHLFIYGPFALSGVLAPASNKDFDASLKARSDGIWGIRDAAWVTDLAYDQGLELTAMTLMPANNFFVVFTKVNECTASNAEGQPAPDDAETRKAAKVEELVSGIVQPAREALLATLAENR